MFSTEREAAARMAAFHWLELREASGQSAFSRSELESFAFEGERIPLIDQSRGIRNPAAFAATLSVLSSAMGPYSDETMPGGLIRYDYRTGEGGDNTKLRRAADLGSPIIYFRRVRPGSFVADYPVYLTDVPAERVVLLAIGEDLRILGDPASMTSDQRSYAERVVRQRLHQPLFRARVMHAYAQRCAVCDLRHADLLDAAHIIPDPELLGAPAVTNGLALCKIHHAAYDRNLLGVSPDYTVHINVDLMFEIDGPMLQYGIQGMDKRPLRLPERRSERPDRERLRSRYDEFLQKA